MLLHLALLGLKELIARSTSVPRWQAKQTQLLSCGAWCSRHSLSCSKIWAHAGDGEAIVAWWCSSGGSELLVDALGGCKRRLLEERLLALKGKSWIGALRWQHLRRLADLRGRVCSDLLLQELILEELLLLLGRGRVEEEGLLAGGPWVGGVEATALSIVWIHSVLYFVIVDISQCVSFRVLECTFDFFFINDYTSSFISKSVNTVLAS